MAGYGSGTYAINADCTGTATLNFSDGRPSVLLSLIVVRQGTEVHTVVDNPGAGSGVHRYKRGHRRD